MSNKSTLSFCFWPPFILWYIPWELEILRCSGFVLHTPKMLGQAFRCLEKHLINPVDDFFKQDWQFSLIWRKNEKPFKIRPDTSYGPWTNHQSPEPGIPKTLCHFSYLKEISSLGWKCEEQSWILPEAWWITARNGTCQSEDWDWGPNIVVGWGLSSDLSTGMLVTSSTCRW